MCGQLIACGILPFTKFCILVCPGLVCPGQFPRRSSIFTLSLFAPFILLSSFSLSLSFPIYIPSENFLKQIVHILLMVYEYQLYKHCCYVHKILILMETVKGTHPLVIPSLLYTLYIPTQMYYYW